MLRGQPQALFTPGAGNMDPFLVIMILQAAGHLSRAGPLPPLTSRLALVTAVAFVRQRLMRELLGWRRFLSISDYGLQPMLVWRRAGLSLRLLVSNFLQTNTASLASDLCALMFVGPPLERRQRPEAFSKLLAYSLVAPNLFFVFMARVLSAWSSRYRALYSRSYFVGLSGALFCLTTVHTLRDLAPRDAEVLFFGFPIPSRHALWAELAILQVLAPGSPVLRHAAGLLAGLAYVHAPPLLPSSGRRYLSGGQLLGGRGWPWQRRREDTLWEKLRDALERSRRRALRAAREAPDFFRA